MEAGAGAPPQPFAQPTPPREPDELDLRRPEPRRPGRPVGAVLGFRWRWEQGCPPTAETAGLPGRPWPVTRPFPRGWLPGSRELICYLLGRLPEPPPPRPCLFSASPTPPPPAPPSETETSGTPGPASRQPSWVPARVYLLWGGPGGLGGAAGVWAEPRTWRGWLPSSSSFHGVAPPPAALLSLPGTSSRLGLGEGRWVD